jgi:hypothetical protein
MNIFHKILDNAENDADILNISYEKIAHMKIWWIRQ